MILINNAYYVGSSRPIHSSIFTRSTTGKLFYLIAIISLIFMSIYIIYTFHWWYVFIEFIAFVIIVSNGHDFIIKYPILSGQLLTLVNLFGLVYLFLN